MTDVLLILSVLLGAGAGTFLVAGSPDFWLGLAGAVARAALPLVFRLLKPRYLTQEQRDLIAGGKDPFSIRPFGRQKGE